MAMAPGVGVPTLVRRGDSGVRFARRRRAGVDDPASPGHVGVPVREDPGQAAAERPVNEEETMVRLLCANLAVVSLILIVTVATLYLLIH